jgi:hypothetical protein
MLELNGIHPRVRAGDTFELQMDPIRNTVSGGLRVVEARPGRPA